MRTLIVAAFGVIQLILAARIGIDMGFIPADGAIAGLVVPASEALAAPIQAVADAIGLDFGSVPGAGMNPAILTALIGWSVVEGVALMLFGGSGSRSDSDA